MKLPAKKALTAALVGLSFLGLSACGQNQDTVALQMGQTSVSMDEFAQLSAEIDELFGQGMQIPRDQILSNVIVSHYLMDNAGQHGLRVSDSDLEELFGPMLSSDFSETSDATKNLLRVQLLAQTEAANPAMMQWQQEAVETMMNDDIQVNSRYGSFDPQTLTVQAAATPWQVEP